MGGRAAIQSRPATQATVLLTPEARPAWESGGGVHGTGGQRWKEGCQAKAEQHGHRKDGCPVAGVGADAHGERGCDRAHQAAGDYLRPGPMRWASRPLAPDSSRVTAVTGTSAEPATTGL
jgi:hypothetical protein